MAEPTPNLNAIGCVLSAKTGGEQLFGSAAESRVWLMIELNETWGGKALEESSLSPALKTHLNSLPARIQVIKQDTPLTNGVRVFIADETTLYHLTLPDTDALYNLDLSDLTRFPRYEKSLYLVCTNGKRDICCAKYGLAAYQELRAIYGEAVWQTNHLGGHRFAATAICFPYGLAFGWLDDAARVMVETYEQGEILLEKYRGRASYSPVAQAAEYYLRQRTQNRAIHAYQLEHVENYPHRYWRVSFSEAATGKVWSVFGQMVNSSFAVYKSTTDTQPVQVEQTQLLSIASV